MSWYIICGMIYSLEASPDPVFSTHKSDVETRLYSEEGHCVHQLNLSKDKNVYTLIFSLRDKNSFNL